MTDRALGAPATVAGATAPGQGDTRPLVANGRLASPLAPAHHAEAPPAVPSEGLLALRLAAAEEAEPLLALVPLDSGAVVVWSNRSAADLVGVRPHELVGRVLPAASGEPEPGQDWSVVAAAQLDRPGDWLAARVDRPDGSRQALSVLTRHAPPHGWVVHLRPVVDTDEAVDAALAAARDRLLALAEHAPLGIVMSEGGARLGFVNDRLVELVGVARDRLLGTNWLDLVDPGDLSALQDALHEVLNGKATDVEVRLLSATAAPRRLQWRLAPVTTTNQAAGFIATVEDVTVRRAWESRLTHQATHDALTGLPNRRQLVEVLSGLMGSRRDPDRSFGVLFCDLDGFKAINDTLGHETGDRVLIEVARRLRSNARGGDLVCRIAGDEFVIVLRSIHDQSDVEAALGRHAAAVGQPLFISGRELRVSVSIGLAIPDDDDTPETLLRAADRRMYDAKRRAREARSAEQPGASGDVAAEASAAGDATDAASAGPASPGGTSSGVPSSGEASAVGTSPDSASVGSRVSPPRRESDLDSTAWRGRGERAENPPL